MSDKETAGGELRLPVGSVRSLTRRQDLEDGRVSRVAPGSRPGAGERPPDPDAHVFTMSGGGPGRTEGNGGLIRAGNFRKLVFSRAVRDAGLHPDLTPHDLRDTAGAIAFANSATVKEVQWMLGHKKAAITLDRYTGVLESMAARTDERLDAAFRAITAESDTPKVATLAIDASA